MSTPEAGPSKDMRKLIKHRVSIKSTIQVINEYVKNFNPAIHSSRQLQIRLTKLNECIDLFNEVQQSIADLDQGYDEERERLIFEDECLTLKATMEDLIAKNTPTEILIQVQRFNHKLNCTMSTPEAGPSKDMRKLIKHRVSIKSTIQVINEYVKNFNPAIHSSRQLQIRLTKLNECIDLFNEVQQSIADLDQGYDEERERLIFEDECL
ncbi:hypothetical protein AGLY_017775, partial [Aphis glycines]